MAPLFYLLLVIFILSVLEATARNINERFEEKPNSMWSYIAGGCAVWLGLLGVANIVEPDNLGFGLVCAGLSLVIAIGMVIDNYSKTQD